MESLVVLPITIIDCDDQITVSVDFGDDLITSWCLKLCLLTRDLIQACVIVDNVGSYKLKIIRDSQLSQSVRGKVKWQSSGVDLWISQSVKSRT